MHCSASRFLSPPPKTFSPARSRYRSCARCAPRASRSSRSCRAPWRSRPARSPLHPTVLVVGATGGGSARKRPREVTPAHERRSRRGRAGCYGRGHRAPRAPAAFFLPKRFIAAQMRAAEALACGSSPPDSAGETGPPAAPRALLPFMIIKRGRARSRSLVRPLVRPNLSSNLSRTFHWRARAGRIDGSRVVCACMTRAAPVILLLRQYMTVYLMTRLAMHSPRRQDRRSPQHHRREHAVEVGHGGPRVERRRSRPRAG